MCGWAFLNPRAFILILLFCCIRAHAALFFAVSVLPSLTWPSPSSTDCARSFARCRARGRGLIPVNFRISKLALRSFPCVCVFLRA
jgi:hypothetical protein